MDYSPCPPSLRALPDDTDLLHNYQLFVRSVCEGAGWDYQTHWLFVEYADTTADMDPNEVVL